MISHKKRIYFFIDFPGQYWDSEKGSWYNHHRDYDANLGRYLQSDPLGLVAGVNTYGYVSHNPLRAVDPSGLVEDYDNGGFSGFVHGLFQGLVADGAQTGQAALGNAYIIGPFIRPFVNMVDLSADGIWGGATSNQQHLGRDLSFLVPISGLAGYGRKIVTKVCDIAGRRLGDLTRAEIRQIQNVVDEVGRPLDVVGSAARGQRRNPGSNLPFGKEDGMRSDIDFITHPQHLPYFSGRQSNLPEIDPGTGIVPGTHNPFQGPSIRFEPNSKPVLNSGSGG